MSPLRPSLKVIEGGGARTTPLLSLPSHVIAKSPFNQSILLPFRIATEDARKALDQLRRQPVLDLWTLVLGQLPPVPNISRFSALTESLERQALQHAHACFRGVKRPVGNDKNGFDMVAYVSKPCTLFCYTPNMVCVVEPLPVPADVVLVTYVRLDFPEGRPSSSRRGKAAAVGGVVSHWEFVESAHNDTLLPRNHQERYRSRLW